MQRVALIGQPLRRRHSEIMHNAAFPHFGIDARYELREIEPHRIPPFVAEVRDADWLGFQVTAPYKQVVMEHLDSVAPDALGIGAVNSVVRTGEGALVGFNTDAPGFRRAVEAELDVDLAACQVAVAGAGGAARAVVQALLSAGTRSITVGNRTLERADALASDFGAPVHAVALGPDFDSVLCTTDLAVNATTLGMIEQRAAFNARLLPDGAAVYDLVYEPPESALLREARERGLRTANGLGMLVAQAEIAFERWTGVTGAGGVMEKALRADMRHQISETGSP